MKTTCVSCAFFTYVTNKYISKVEHLGFTFFYSLKCRYMYYCSWYYHNVFIILQKNQQKIQTKKVKKYFTHKGMYHNYIEKLS